MKSLVISVENEKNSTVEHVDELLLFNGTNHDGPALGVHCNVLARNCPATPALSISLLVNLLDRFFKNLKMRSK